MKNSIKKFYATLLTVILILACSVPFFAMAKTGTLGTESPKLTATFLDANGEEAYGDNLEAGEYTVSIMLSGMQTVSVFELSASYSTSLLSINSVSTIADVDSSFSCGAATAESGKFVTILASKNKGATSSVNFDGTEMVKLNVTVLSAGDFADMFVVKTDPDLTFVEAGYGDGYSDAYVCEINTSYRYNKLSYDMSPEHKEPEPVKNFDVTGQILVCTDLVGVEYATNAEGRGMPNVTVSVDGTEISTVTDEMGYYTLPALEEGEYTLTVGIENGDSIVNRTVTLVVSIEKADEENVIHVDGIPVVICDYNDDGFFDGTDTGSFVEGLAEYNVIYDLSCDGFIDGTDIGLFTSYLGQKVVYTELTI